MILQSICHPAKSVLQTSGFVAFLSSPGYRHTQKVHGDIPELVSSKLHISFTSGLSRHSWRELCLVISLISGLWHIVFGFFSRSLPYSHGVSGLEAGLTS